MNARGFDDFYKRIGFDKYPFRDRTAEKEDTRRLFIKPEQYAMLVDAFDDKQTCIIDGNRGTGKTIIIDDLRRRIEGERLVSYVTNFEGVALKNNLCDFYGVILQEITRSLLVYLQEKKMRMRRLSKEDRVLVSFLIKKYGDSITDSQLKEKIEQIQLSKWKQFLNWFSRPITGIFNYGGTTITNFGNQFLTKNFGAYFPNVSSSEIIKIFPDIKFPVIDDFNSVEISYSMLNMIVERVRNIVGAPLIVFFDKFDEDSRIDNDADILIEFLKELIADNNLLLNENLQLIISIWRIAFRGLSSSFRRSKHFVFDIAWSYEYLINVLNHRLSVFSDGRVTSWKNIFSKDIEQINDLLELSNGNPRDLWDILDNIMRAQYELDNDAEKISIEAVRKGMDTFVAKFNFYEYYPRKKKARKNTNDVYTYITLLLFLKDTDEFTNEELREAASAGGSVTNYITSMQNIGLVEKTDRKRIGGAVVYKIMDPKVAYAIRNKIDIAH